MGRFSLKGGWQLKFLMIYKKGAASMRRLKLRILILIISTILIAGCVAEKSSTSNVKPAITTVDKQISEDGVAVLYIFNISGWTLIPSNQEVIDGEETIVSIPRNTYKKIAVSPGIHNLRPSYRKLPKVDLKAIKGNTYYVVIGYRPERSWALPLLGDPMILKLISKDEAEPLLKELKQH